MITSSLSSYLCLECRKFECVHSETYKLQLLRDIQKIKKQTRDNMESMYLKNLQYDEAKSIADDMVFGSIAPPRNSGSGGMALIDSGGISLSYCLGQKPNKKLLLLRSR